MNSISAVVPFLVAKVAQAKGADPEPLLRGTGVDSDQPPPAEEHLDAEKYFNVWRRAVAIFGAAFPFDVARAVTIEDLEVFGFLVLSCHTLGQAYEKAAGYRALYCVGARWEVDLTAEATRLIWYSWPGDANDPGYQAANEFSGADMANVIRRLGANAPMPREVRTPTPLDTAFYGVAPVKGPLYELVYAAGLVEQPISTFNAKLRDYFDATCKQLVAALPINDTMTAQLRSLDLFDRWRRLDGSDREAARHQLAHAAAPTRRGEHHVQRRARRGSHRVREALSVARHAVGERGRVPRRLHRAPSAFFKAFKRSTGMTPREFATSSRVG